MSVRRRRSFDPEQGRAGPDGRGTTPERCRRLPGRWSPAYKTPTDYRSQDLATRNCPGQRAGIGGDVIFVDVLLRRLG